MFWTKFLAKKIYFCQKFVQITSRCVFVLEQVDLGNESLIYFNATVCKLIDINRPKLTIP